MMDSNAKSHRAMLQRIARRAMIERGLFPDFSPQALAELDRINAPATRTEETTRDLRNLPWCSIDNDDSRDLDQLTVAEAMSKDSLKILDAIADVDAIVKNGSAIDDHAWQNTTSVYTAAETFPLLPEKLSTNFTSLNYGTDRLAIVTGAAPKGTWVRLLHPPIEGKLVHGFEGMDVGHKIRVQLIHTDVEQGFIDFKKVE